MSTNLTNDQAQRLNRILGGKSNLKGQKTAAQGLVMVATEIDGSWRPVPDGYMIENRRKEANIDLSLGVQGDTICIANSDIAHVFKLPPNVRLCVLTDGHTE